MAGAPIHPRHVRAIACLALVTVAACSSGTASSTADTAIPDTAPSASSSSSPTSLATWTASSAPTPDIASWVNFCCDGDIPESPQLGAPPPSPGAYPVSITGWTEDGDLIVALSRFRSCDDDAFRNNFDFGCLEPDPEMPHDAAIDNSSSIDFVVDLDDPSLTVHVLGIDCGDDGSVRSSDWSGSGQSLRMLADRFDADFDAVLVPLGDTYFDETFDPASNGFPARFAHTCTDIGLAWTDGAGPSLWIPGASSDSTEMGTRPIADFVWGRALVLGEDSTTLYLFAGYSP